MTDTLYATPPMTIGKHQWRLIVQPSPYGGNSTLFQWRRGDEPWKCQREWLSYNFNDGTYLGLPKGLVRLWRRHQEEILAALKGEVHVPEQLTLISEAALTSTEGK